MKKVIMFGSERCSNCKIMHPRVAEAMKKFINCNKGEFYFVAIEQNKELAQKYNIKGVPQVIIFNEEGNILVRLAGIKDRKEINMFLETYL